MVATLLSWLYIFILTVGLGFISVDGYGHFRKQALPQLPVYILSLLGLSGLTGFLGFYSLFAPLNAITHLWVLLIMSVHAGCRYRRYTFFISRLQRYAPRQIIVGCALIGLLVLNLLFWSTSQPVNDDTGFYHSQTIKWMEHYSVIPGLGNLHGRLAFNSSFLWCSAFFSVSFLTGQPLFTLTSYLFLLWGITVVFFLLERLSAPKLFGILSTLLFILHLDFFDVWLSSPTPDIPGAILVGFAFILSLQKLDALPLPDAQFRTATIILLVLVSITVKLSMLPVIGLFFYLVYKREIAATPGWLLFFVMSVAVIIAPWLVRNIVQTGYLVYPFPAFGFQVDWRIPLAAVIEEKDFIHSMARIMAQDWQHILQMPLQTWFPIWFSQYNLFYRVVLIGAAASPLVNFYLFFKKSAAFSGTVKTAGLLLWVVNYAGVIFWFCNAPDVRFGVIFLYLSFLFPLYWSMYGFIKRYSLIITNWLLAVLFLCGAQQLRDAVYQIRYQTNNVQARLVWPEKQPDALLKKVIVGNITVWLPKQGVLCWDAPLPCTYQIQPGLELRGHTLLQGFRIAGKK